MADFRYMYHFDWRQYLQYFLGVLIDSFWSLTDQIFLILASLFFLVAIVILFYSRFVLAWDLWKHLCVDTFTIMVLPALMLVLSPQLSDIKGFCTYEALKSKYDIERFRKDSPVHVWVHNRYYDHFTKVGKKRISVGFDASERHEALIT